MATISIYEAEKIAQESGDMEGPITLVAPTGKITKTKWLDPFMGLVMLDGGFILSSDLHKLGMKVMVNHEN